MYKNGLRTICIRTTTIIGARCKYSIVHPSISEYMKPATHCCSNNSEHHIMKTTKTDVGRYASTEAVQSQSPTETEAVFKIAQAKKRSRQLVYRHKYHNKATSRATDRQRRNMQAITSFIQNKTATYSFQNANTRPTRSTPSIATNKCPDHCQQRVVTVRILCILLYCYPVIIVQLGSRWTH